MVGTAGLKAVGLVAASLLMPALGVTAMPEMHAIVEPASGPTATPMEPASQQPLTVRPAYASAITTWAGYLPDYNPSDLNGGSRGFAPASLTVNQTLPAATGR